MSTHTEAAVRELSKEIGRLTAMRDSLLTPGVAVASAPSKAAKTAPTKPTTTGGLSAETKKRIADAQKKRWAAIKKAKGGAAPAKAATAKK